MDNKCPHMNFDLHADIHRIQKSEQEPDVIVAYQAEVRVFCHECKQEFEWFGLPAGMSFYQPTVSIDGKELHAPLVLPGTQPPEGLAGFRVTQTAGPGNEVTH